MKTLKSTGDTIIEVLLAITVMGSVLAGAYVTANRSQQNIRQAQERVEALQLVQSQIEQIRVTKDAFDVNEEDNFCIVDGLVVTTDTTANCNFGSPVARYNIVANRRGNDSDGHTFKLTAVWDSIVGGQDRMDMSYRAYKP